MYSINLTAAQNAQAATAATDPEVRRDLPMSFRWRHPACIRDCRALPWTSDPKRNHAIAGIVAEAMSIAGTDQRISVSLRRDWYVNRERIVGAGYTYIHVREAMKALLAGGWIEIIKGKAQRGGSGLQTVLWPTEQLIECVGLERALVYGLRDPVIMRGLDGDPMPIPDTRELRRVRVRLERAREAYAATDLRLDAPDVIWTPDAPMQIDGRWYDPRRKAPHAVYNVTTTAGGRWYGLPYQTLSNRTHGRRAQLVINGQPVEEPDFGGCHPRLLFHERGLEPDGDDLYDVAHPVYGRDQVKLAVQVLINASNECSGIMGFCYRLAAQEAKAEREAGGPILSSDELDARAKGHEGDAVLLFERLKARHAPIGEAFFTGAGTRLQHTETQIMTRAAMACLDRGVVVFPMHDSAITVAGEHASILREEMQRSYVAQIGMEPRIG